MTFVEKSPQRSRASFFPGHPLIPIPILRANDERLANDARLEQLFFEVRHYVAVFGLTVSSPVPGPAAPSLGARHMRIRSSSKSGGPSVMVHGTSLIALPAAFAPCG